MNQFGKLERILGVPFRNIELCREAMTHKSFAAEHNLKYDNQRLEFLGDAVVQIVLTRYLYELYPDFQEGDLTKIRSSLANQDSLARFARHISLGEFLMLGRGEIESDGANRDSTLSDAFESLIAAVYLDHGLETAQQLILRLIDELQLEPATALQRINPKGALQEWTQGHGLKVPVYTVLSVSGPDHDPQYEVQVSIHDRAAATARARSRKLAEGAAAQKALDLLASGELVF